MTERVLYMSTAWKDELAGTLATSTDQPMYGATRIVFHPYLGKTRRATRSECSWRKWWLAKLHLIDHPRVANILVVDPESEVVDSVKQ